jgi:hypothetical protein
MSDLTQRLRKRVRFWSMDGTRWYMDNKPDEDCEEAADRIEALEAELAATRELMNVYNLGGWNDALAPMQRALKAEAELERAKAAERSAWNAAVARDEQLERVGQDARRYQWLRNRPPKYDSGEWRKYVWFGVAYTMHYDEVNERLGADLDAAIDSELDAEAAAQNVASARRPDETEPEGASQDTPQG